MTDKKFKIDEIQISLAGIPLTGWVDHGVEPLIKAPPDGGFAEFVTAGFATEKDLTNGFFVETKEDAEEAFNSGKISSRSRDILLEMIAQGQQNNNKTH
jgi:hypothetical protein